MPGQWSYTVGPCRGIELGDHVWLSRYLLLRLSEQFKVRPPLVSCTCLSRLSGVGVIVYKPGSSKRTARTECIHALQVIASTDPKPVPGDWLGNGAPIKFSTRETRQEGKGWFVIQEHLRRLQQVSLLVHLEQCT